MESNPFASYKTKTTALSQLFLLKWPKYIHLLLI